MKKEALDDIKNEIEVRINSIIEQIKDGRIDSETSITDRLMERLQDFRYYNTYHETVYYSIKSIDLQFLVSVRTLGDRGRDSSESKYGADACLIMDINDKDKRRKKGILIQSKMNTYPLNLVKKKSTYLHFLTNNKKFNELNKQLIKMGEITPEHYILVYDSEGFYIVRGNKVMNPEKDKTKISLKVEDFSDFLIKMIKCLRGDMDLTEWTDNYFEELIQHRFARYYILIKVFFNQLF